MKERKTFFRVIAWTGILMWFYYGFAVQTYIKYPKVPIPSQGLVAPIIANSNRVFVTPFQKFFYDFTFYGSIVLVSGVILYRSFFEFRKRK